MKTGIIITCYNVEQAINQEAFLSFLIRNKDYHLCFVNDGSTDATLKLITSMKEIDPEGISIIDVQKRIGKPAAVRLAVNLLYNMRSIAYIGQMDVKLSIDFNDLKRMVQILKSEDKFMVVGARNICDNKNVAPNLLKCYLLKLKKQIIYLLLGIPFQDIHCEARVFVRNIVPIIYGDSFASKWSYDIEIFLRLKNYIGKCQLINKICELPIRNRHTDNSTKRGVFEIVEGPLTLIYISLKYNYFHTYSAAWRSYSIKYEKDSAGSKMLFAA